MSVARVSEIIVRSKDSFDDALIQGVARAHKTLKNVKSVWIHDQSRDRPGADPNKRRMRGRR
jgi:flavin-binding protein dodecin